MPEIMMGEIVRRRRKELKLTQAELAEGICDSMTISRLENNRQTPRRSLMCAILERLDLPVDRYMVLLFQEEKEVEFLRREISAANVRFEQAAPEKRPAIREEAFALHRRLEKATGAEDVFTRQQIARSRLILGTEEGPYPPAQERALLLEILHMSCPHFDPQNISRGHYTVEEIKMINHLGVTYAQEGNHAAAMEIFRQLYQYVEHAFRDYPKAESWKIPYYLNYINELIALGEYAQANQLAGDARICCIRNGYYNCLPGILDALAESAFYLGEQEACEHYFQQAYSFTSIIEDSVGAKAIAADYQQLMGRSILKE